MRMASDGRPLYRYRQRYRAWGLFVHGHSIYGRHELDVALHHAHCLDGFT